jgi:6-phosphogluconolactonase (cycloisomerase 2 family)
VYESERQLQFGASRAVEPRVKPRLLLPLILLVFMPATAHADMPGMLFDVHSVAIAPDGHRVYAGQGLGSPYVAFSRDPQTGLLTFLPRPTFAGSASSAGGEFRRTIAVSPDSGAVYDSKNGENALRQMTVTDSSLANRRTYTNYQDGISGMSGPQVIGIAPDGGCVYVTALNSYPASIVAFRRDPATNDLTYGSTFTASGFEAWDEMAFSGDGGFMYVAAGTSGLTVLDRDASSCALSANETVPAAGAQVMGLAIAPGGGHLYAVDPFGKRLFSFTRNATDGTVALTQTITEGVGGAAGLDGVTGVVVSPDGKNVYTTANTENALTVWDRNATTGDLSLHAVVHDGAAIAGSLAKAQTLVISSDGTSIYVGASAPTNAVSVFRRNPTTGDVTFLQKITDADGPSTAIGGGPARGSGTGTGGQTGTGSGGPTPPPGPTGVSIENGTRYTNDPHVHISVVWPLGAATLSIANDGGFKAARTFPVAASIPWKLDSSGPERLPKTVYVRFGASTQTFTDDIILDETAPKIISATLTHARRGPASAAAASGAVLKIRARDNVSGVVRIQVTADRRHAGKLRKYSSRVAVTAKSRLWVRVRDRAGNFSRWRSVSARRR